MAMIANFWKVFLKGFEFYLILYIQQFALHKQITYLFPHCAHWKGFSPVWTTTWWSKACLVVNFLPQTEQIRSFSPVCNLLCCAKSRFHWNPRPHSSHLYAEASWRSFWNEINRIHQSINPSYMYVSMYLDYDLCKQIMENR